jgi:hypothetical protein
MRQGERTDLEPCANLHKVDQTGAAGMLSVSRRTVVSAAAVLASGTPELQKAVDRGEIKVSVAADLAKLAPEKQNDAGFGQSPSSPTTGGGPTVVSLSASSSS